MRNFAILVLCAFTLELSAAEPTYGISLYGPTDLKYKEGETYAHANPNAPKGGILKLTWLGSFTKLNPFSLKGNPAPGAGMAFETLMDSSVDGDEPFAEYGLLAEKVQLADDKNSITYFMNKKAKFSDGKPVTADDVVFSFNLIQDPEFLPHYKSYYEDVEKAEKIDDHTVKFTFKKFNQELPMIVGQLSILPKHIYGVEGKKFGEDFDETAVGSGAYMVEAFDKSTHITLKRNPDYWGRDIPVNRGRYNFDKIIFKVFLSDIPAREALKGSLIDAEQIAISKDWALEFGGDYFKKNYIKKETFKHNRVSGMQCYVFNLRKQIFQDIKVRKAIAAVMDFEFMNKNYFYNQYKRQVCYFDNNKEMMSRGPAEGKVKEILTALQEKYGKENVPKDAIARGPYNVGDLPDGATMPIEERIKLANKMLDEEGYLYDKELGARKKGDNKLGFEILIANQTWEKIVNPFIERLNEIGIKATYRLVQPAEYFEKIKDFKYDMIVTTFGQSMSPGNEQRNYWSSKEVDVKGSMNLIGIKNPAIDDMVEQLIAARDRKSLVACVQVLDRILCANHYVVPHWYIDYDRAIFWNRFSGSKVYASKASFMDNLISWWWYDADKDKKLQEARDADKPFAE